MDPTPNGEAVAREAGARWFSSFADMIAVDRPDGIIVATPNQVHVKNGFEAIEAGIPALIEKPLADDIASGESLIAAAEAKGVPLLTGHHRRHNPMMRKAKDIIDSGRLGQVLVINAMFWLFQAGRLFRYRVATSAGAGPIFLNLIHDIDNLRYLSGDISAVQARESNAVRGNAVEETAVILIEFENGVLATASVSDAVVAPWSWWEMTTGENRFIRKPTEPATSLAGRTVPSPSRPWRSGATRQSAVGGSPSRRRRPRISRRTRLPCRSGSSARSSAVRNARSSAVARGSRRSRSSTP
ncbi:Gfo/Idh/MocA family oxidoreductase [Rhizobium cremeum]|uniref:Gfo/Idh/MocA family protein n=1 Tax=Rhizobium cremeum TaxID=2813827 RepID=UPI003140BC07